MNEMKIYEQWCGLEGDKESLPVGEVSKQEDHENGNNKEFAESFFNTIKLMNGKKRNENVDEFSKVSKRLWREWEREGVYQEIDKTRKNMRKTRKD